MTDDNNVLHFPGALTDDDTGRVVLYRSAHPDVYCRRTDGYEALPIEGFFSQIVDGSVRVGDYEMSLDAARALQASIGAAIHAATWDRLPDGTYHYGNGVA